MIGYALCGSFCTHAKSLAALTELVRMGYDVLPIVSECVYGTDTRFGRAEELVKKLESLCKKPVIHTIAGAEPLGPVTVLDLLVIAPCTGNTLAKMAHGITDTAVTMAAKAQLRSDRPVLIGLATNDALSANLPNLALLSSKKHISFVPLEADDPEKKPYSLVCRFDRIPETVKEMTMRQ